MFAMPIVPWSRTPLVRRRAPSRRLALVIALAATLASASGASAGQPSTQTLNPQPPDFYTCKAVGAGTICQAHTVEPYELEPTGIICGSGAGTFEPLDSGIRDVHARREYDRDGNYLRRIRTLLFRDAHLTNPLTGKTISYAQHNTDVDELAVPGDLSTDTFTGHGHLTITVPGMGAVLLEAGRTVVGPSGEVESQSGPSQLSDYFAGDAHALDALCTALQAV